MRIILAHGPSYVHPVLGQRSLRWPPCHLQALGLMQMTPFNLQMDAMRNRGKAFLPIGQSWPSLLEQKLAINTHL